MKLSSGKWPSLGFIAVCLNYSLVAAFFAWGLSNPALDRAWALQHELKIGKVGRLSTAERTLFERCLSRYPKMVLDLLDGSEIGILSANRDGWISTPTATLLRTPKSGQWHELVLDIQTPSDLIPYAVVVRGRGWEKRLPVTRQGVIRVELPPAPAEPELFEVRLRGKKFEPDPSLLGVRIGFGPEP